MPQRRLSDTMGMDALGNLTNQFLIATPSLTDPHFAHTVTYICEHSAEGTMGIVINRPLDITIGDVLAQTHIVPSNRFDSHQPVFGGGPVQQEHGFVLHAPAGAWDSSLRINEQLAVTTSRDILSAIAHREGPAHYLVALGYAGWGAQQLERELLQNSWLIGPATPQILFETPVADRWQAAAQLMGIDLRLLSSEVGHA